MDRRSFILTPVVIQGVEIAHLVPTSDDIQPDNSVVTTIKYKGVTYALGLMLDEFEDISKALGGLDSAVRGQMFTLGLCSDTSRHLFDKRNAKQ